MTLKEYCSEFKFKKDMAMGGAKFDMISIYRWKAVDSTDLQQMLFLLGPLSVTIDGINALEYDGKGPHFANCSSEESDSNFSALLVGYGTDSFGDYWLLKFNQGPRFGDHGYAKLVRGSDQNTCGVFNLPLGIKLDVHTE
eukprot:CAMPEP_0203792688 /NCGR_PEP_ID=MMETSP0100_2-20121128/5405_1 /ASSEMBLY_ACC=CAM_ASM_000210 /TAXON_ID=96639 /ORGANISM=" , Strain NY0313808BC1" /LENGTH=139 /DNA_ID=CAMNT_0050696297 /DNA_START=1132 /DNA_END=1551 /DNA_ORIENTATION=+